MKKTLLILTLFFFTIHAQAQVDEVDARILEVYPSAKIEWMQEHDPARLEKITNVLLYSYELVDASNYEVNKLASFQVVDVVDLNALNVLQFANFPMNGQAQFFYNEANNVVIRILTLSEFEQSIKSK